MTFVFLVIANVLVFNTIPLGPHSSITMSSFPQSAPLTYSLAALGGVLEVFATAILAYPDAREKQGIKVSNIVQRLALTGNVTFQILASLSGNLFATWFGPVSLVGPIFFSAQLVANVRRDMLFFVL